MSWETIIDQMKEWVKAQAYATIVYVDAEIATLKAWVIAQAYATQAWVLAKNYLQQAFYDRGDPAAYDWIHANLTLDGNWHVLDMSAEMPASAQGAVLRVIIRANATGRKAFFRTTGNNNINNAGAVETSVASINNRQDIILVANGNQSMEYKFDNVTWEFIGITVGAWIL